MSREVVLFPVDILTRRFPFSPGHALVDQVDRISTGRYRQQSALYRAGKIKKVRILKYEDCIEEA